MFWFCLALGAAAGAGAVAFALASAGWPPPAAAMVTFGLGIPLVIAVGVALKVAGLPLLVAWLVPSGLLVVLAIVYERVALMRRVRSLSAISLARADKDIDAGPGGQVVLELQRAGYERIGAFRILLDDGRSFPTVVLRSEDGATYAEVFGPGGCHLTSSFGTLRLVTARNHGVVHPARFLRQREKGDMQQVIAAHGAALGLLAGHDKEPRCLSEVEILDEIEADSYEVFRLAVGMTFVEHLVAPVRKRREAARLDRDARAPARIERWLESEAATA